MTQRRRLSPSNFSDLVHGVLVVFICTCATVYAVGTNDHSGNIWIIYSAGIAFAAGRAGAGVYQRSQTRANDFHGPDGGHDGEPT